MHLTSHEVVPGLWVGNVECRPDPRFAAVVGVLTQDEHLRYRDVPLPAGRVLYLDHGDRKPGLLEAAGGAWDFIDAAGDGPTLVHCAAGASRSVAVVAGLLVARRGYALRAALDLLVDRRPQAMHLWHGYVRELEALEGARGAALAAAVRQYVAARDAHNAAARDVLRSAAGGVFGEDAGGPVGEVVEDGVALTVRVDLGDGVPRWRWRMPTSVALERAERDLRAATPTSGEGRLGDAARDLLAELLEPIPGFATDDAAGAERSRARLLRHRDVVERLRAAAEAT